MKNQIANYVKAGYSGLFIVSHEETRVEAELKAVAKATEFELRAWSLTTGIVDSNGEAIPETQDPLQVLGSISALPEKSILLLRDFHLFLAQPNPMLSRNLKDALAIGKSSNRVIVIVGCKLQLQPELEKEITVIEFSLPTREDLLVTLRGIADSAGIKLNGNTDKLLDAASGMTTTEAENAFALSIIETKTLSPDVIAREKSHTVRKNGLLEIVENSASLEEIGGLENLKRDLHEKRNLFSKEAREYGLPTPRGLLVLGQSYSYSYSYSGGRSMLRPYIDNNQ